MIFSSVTVSACLCVTVDISTVIATVVIVIGISADSLCGKFVQVDYLIVAVTTVWSVTMGCLTISRGGSTVWSVVEIEIFENVHVASMRSVPVHQLLNKTVISFV